MGFSGLRIAQFVAVLLLEVYWVEVEACLLRWLDFRGILLRQRKVWCVQLSLRKLRLQIVRIAFGTRNHFVSLVKLLIVLVFNLHLVIDHLYQVEILFKELYLYGLLDDLLLQMFILHLFNFKLLLLLSELVPNLSFFVLHLTLKKVESIFERHQDLVFAWYFIFSHWFLFLDFIFGSWVLFVHPFEIIVFLPQFCLQLADKSVFK